MSTGILIGIAGASGAGKTHIARSIEESIGPDKAVIIQEDSYYKDLSDVPYEERAGKNFDHPSAFDHDLLVKHLSQLLKGESVSLPVYDYKVHSRSKETKTVDAHELIILEGILTLSNQLLRGLMDLRVFIETPLDICFIRRLKRDITERGRTVESVIEQYIKTVRPMYLEFIEPLKKYADILISGGEEDGSSIEILITRINTILAGSQQ